MGNGGWVESTLDLQLQDGRSSPAHPRAHVLLGKTLNPNIAPVAVAPVSEWLLMVQPIN